MLRRKSKAFVERLSTSVKNSKNCTVPMNRKKKSLKLVRMTSISILSTSKCFSKETQTKLKKPKKR